MDSIKVNNLCKKYDKFFLDNVSFNVPKGSIVGLIGENGAGKTTTIKSILDLINIDSGNIEINNSNYLDYNKEDIGVVLDNSFLSDELTPGDINNIMMQIYKNWDIDLYNKYLTSFKLPKDKIIKEYSSGMLMKLKIATCLSHKPKLLILDEPTSGLDPIARSELLDIFRDFITDLEHSILISSHITSDLEHIADYIVFISDGKIILNEDIGKLLNEYGMVKCKANEFKMINKEDYLNYKKYKYNYHVLIKNRKEFKKKYDIKVIDKPTIEDIMVIMIKGDNNNE